MDLAEFLLARIAEDEAHAEKDLWVTERTSPGDWTAYYGINLPHSYIGLPDDRVAIATLNGPRHEGDCMHIGRFKPATMQTRARRVLAECEAKKAIVELYAEHAEYDDPENSYEHATGRIVGLGEALRLLALPDASHPDYRDEWKP